MAKLFMEFSFFKTLFFFFYRVVFRQFKNPKPLRRNVSNIHANEGKYHRYPSFAQYRSNLSNQTLVFNVEDALLKPSSLFPYFMLVAFEAGGLLRAFILFVLYPFLCLVSEEMGLKIMVLVCFFGIKKKNFRVGSAVLPKFFLEDVGLETFEMLKQGGKKVGFSNIPQVMIESFLKDYLEIDFVVGRELKVFRGYFLGVMEEKKRSKAALEKIIGSQSLGCDHVIGISDFKKSLEYNLFSQCKEIYLVRKADKRSWQQVPKEKYPKPLIFHDGRLAFRPTLLSTLTMFVWFPFGLALSIIRTVIALTLPYKISIPVLSYSGLHLFLSIPQPYYSLQNSKNSKPKGRLYVCNHRTLLDPLYLSFSLQKDLTAVTYSLSRVSELLAPIKTFRLARDRDQDRKMIEKLLNQGDLVVCPEGTTCREPYLLRFSSLFAEMSDDIVPVAMDSHVSMFYGTTAGGLKCLDPLFFLMNPRPSYNVQMLDAVSGLSICHDHSERSRFDVANHVQNEIGRALGFERTRLTRRDKYLILAGNEGIVSKP